MKALSRWRLLDQYYLLALDGTGIWSSEKRHCDYCLKAEIDGREHYYHHVLVAQLVTAHGLALTVGFEFIDNRDILDARAYKNEEERKQDCELKAFYRLAPRLKRHFPQLPLCVLADSLYLGQPFFDICRRSKWRYMVVFKEGSMPATYQEYEKLKALSMPTPIVIDHKGARQEYQWVNDIDYEGHKLNALECHDFSGGEDTPFVWVTDLPITEKNFSKLANHGGRQRWKVENQGFNIQKNGGYGLEHAYSLDPNAMVNFFALLQIAHILNQLMEMGSLLGKAAVQALGGLYKVARRLLESLRYETTTPEEFDQLFLEPFQIRLDSP